MVDKNKRKLQVLCSDQMYQDFERILFWYRVEGITDKKSMSAFLRDVLQDYLDTVPEEYKQSLKNIKR